jgi:hypothetical protein
MADNDIREGDPDKPRKKKAPPPGDVDDRPRKKKPADDDEDDEEEAPRKKKRIAKDDDEEEAPRKKKKVRKDDDDEEGDLGSSPLSAIMPVGGSVFALLSLWVGFISFLLGFVALGSSFDLITIWGIGKIPPIATCLMPMLWPVALLSGGLAFLTHKHKASYGSIVGNARAVFGILFSLGAMVLHAVLVFLFVKGG